MKSSNYKNKKISENIHQNSIQNMRTLIQIKEGIKVINCVGSDNSEFYQDLIYDLGVSFSNIEKRSLLINLDFRSQPQLLNDVLDKEYNGIEDYLKGNTQFDSLFINVSNYLSIITHNSKHNEYSDLVLGDRFGTLINGVIDLFDYIFVISSSLNKTYDAISINKYCDGVLFFKNNDSPKRSILNNYARLIIDSGKPIIGIVKIEVF